MVSNFTRPAVDAFARRLGERPRFLQVVAGPRQVGKTTAVRHALERLDLPWHFASADGPSPADARWIDQQWDIGRLRARASASGGVLVLDEVQKVSGWSEVVKAQWDRDRADRVPLRVVLLGSSPLLVGQGLSESLAGRFEVLHLRHWSFDEMRAAFGWDVEKYVFFGGYPGPAPLADDFDRWAAYVRESIVEPTVGRDVLLLTRVDKPALLRRTLDLGLSHAGEVLSYTKMVGQLQDAGNTVTLAHYLDLLGGAGLLVGLQKHAGRVVRSRGSSPKLVPCATGLVTSREGLTFDEVREDGARWGRLVECAVGAHLVAGAVGTGIDVRWWRGRTHEVDFVLARGDRCAAFEVKSGRRRETPVGLARFAAEFRPRHTWEVGTGGIPLEEFFRTPVATWLA
jgi:hypothetical protein